MQSDYCLYQAYGRRLKCLKGEWLMREWLKGSRL